MDVRKSLGQGSFTGCHPVGDGSHRAERAPGARRIDERQRDANNSGHDDNRPKHFTDASPHRQSPLTPGYETQLDAEHAEDEEHHKQSEAEGAHELGYGTMRRVLRQ